MKKVISQTGVFIMIACSILTASSCDEISGERIWEKDLVGTWSYEDASAQVYVGKVNITRVLVVAHGYTEEEAELILDSLVNDYLEEMGEILVINDDYTYMIDTQGGEEVETGIWDFDKQKDALRLTKTGEKVPVKYTITQLSRTTMMVDLPDRFKVIDLNSDGKKETNITIVTEIRMEKEKPVN